MKAISLLSGGLDSILATKLIMDQGIELEALNFMTVFCNCTSHGKTCLASKSASDELGVPLKVIEISEEYFEIIKNPKHGYGRNINPCLDCRIFMLREAKKYMEDAGASFVVTGEVLGERPMSQRKQAMEIIERESGLAGYIVRPLSAKLFPPSIPEEKGWVDRQKFMDIQGRSRKPQIKLAEELGINDYPCPAGGCLLTDKIFAEKMKDLIKYKPVFDKKDVNILKSGRLFRISNTAKIIVGRDEKENNKLLTLSKDEDLIFQVKDIPGPVGVGKGEFDEESLDIAARIISRYCDSENSDELLVSYKKKSASEEKAIKASALNNDKLEQLRI